MEKKNEKNQISTKDLDLSKIKDRAKALFLNSAPDPRTDKSLFLTQCWVLAVSDELNRIGVLESTIKRDYEHLIKG